MTITIYSTSICAFCKAEAGWLESKKIDFTKKVVDEDPAAMAEFMEVNEGNIGVPFTVIEKDGQTIKIAGFDQKKLSTVLDI